MKEYDPKPQNPLTEPRENDIVTCAFQEKGEPKNIAVRIIQVFNEAPFEGYLFVEIAENPGVFTYSHVNNIVQDQLLYGQ